MQRISDRITQGLQQIQSNIFYFGLRVKSLVYVETKAVEIFSALTAFSFCVHTLAVPTAGWSLTYSAMTEVLPLQVWMTAFAVLGVYQLGSVIYNETGCRGAAATVAVGVWTMLGVSTYLVTPMVLPVNWIYWLLALANVVAVLGRIRE